MPKTPVPADVDTMLANPNPAVMTTVRPDGQPVSVATWYLWENGRIVVNLDEGRKRLDHIRNDPRVSFTVLDGDRWYTHVSLQGKVTELRDDADFADIDRLAEHYTGNAYPRRDRKRITAIVDVDRWHGWGRLENKDVAHH